MKLKTLFVLVLVFFVQLGLLAKPVSIDGARKMAEEFLSVYYSGNDLSVDEVIGYNLENGITGYYFVTLKPVGWVIVSGDDVLKPVIGYSFENKFVPRDQWEISTSSWFDGVDAHITKSLERTDLKMNSEWDELERPSYRKGLTGQAVEPIIEAKWNQSSGWNRFCPEDAAGPGGHAYAGCVAVSMAQAMSVHEYPARPKGSHGYTSDNYGYLYVNYDAQSNYNWDAMSLSSSDDENARLLYHLAVAVNMDFGPDGSGAFTSTAAGALKSYFGYAESTSYKTRSSYSDADWKQMIIDELLQGRPVIYSGNDEEGSAGHAFNVDGVGSGGTYFHLNWGWSGSMNDYYTLDALTPGDSDFSYGSGAVFGMRPPAAGPYDIDLTTPNVLEQQAIGTFVSKVEITDEAEENVYTYSLLGPFNIFYDNYGPAEFYIENDSLKTSSVFDYDENDSEFLIIRVTDTAGIFVSKQFDIAIDKLYYGPTDITLAGNDVEEGKNPGYFVGLLTIEDDIDNNVYTYSCKGGYDAESMSNYDCFIVRNDSVFSKQMFDMDDGLKYYVSIKLTDDYYHSISEIFEIDIVENISGGTGIKDLLHSNLKIYPNPASGFVTIDITEEMTAEEFVIDVYNMLGQTCINCALISGEKLDISELENGTYMLVVRTGQQVLREKLLISK